MHSTKGNGEIRKRTNGGEDLTSKFKTVCKVDSCKSTNFKTIVLVFSSLLLDLLAFTMILPLLPSLLDYYNREEGKGNSLYASILQMVQHFQKLTGAPDRYTLVLFGGALGSMYSFLQFLTSPIVGSLSDAYGRKIMLLICLCGIAVSHALWVFAQSFGVFVLARFIGGLSKANVSLSMAIITDASNEKTRARGMYVKEDKSINRYTYWTQTISMVNTIVTTVYSGYLSVTDNIKIHGIGHYSCHNLLYLLMFHEFGIPLRILALVGLAFSIGFIVGPLAGAWFAKTTDHTSGAWGERPAFYALALSTANIALVWFCLPETLPKEKRVPLSFTLHKTLDYISPWHLLKFTAVKKLSKHQNEVLSKLGLIYFLYLFIYSGLEFTITFLTHQAFEYTAMQQGKMFLVIGLIMAALQGVGARRLGARGAERAARCSLALTPPAFLAVAASAARRAPAVALLAPLTWLWIGLVLYALSTAFAVSCMTSMAAAQAPGGARGAVLGALRSLGALARAAGPLLAATVYWCFGAAVTYSVGAVILIIPTVMLFSLKT